MTFKYSWGNSSLKRFLGLVCGGRCSRDQGLDPELASRSGALLLGATDILSLGQLDAGAVHEITFVMS